MDLKWTAESERRCVHNQREMIESMVERRDLAACVPQKAVDLAKELRLEKIEGICENF